MSLLVYSMRTQMKRICDRKSGRRAAELISAGPCINKNQVKIDKCFFKLNDHLEEISLMDKTRNRTPYLCCEYVTLSECLLNVFSNTTCASKGSVLAGLADNIMGNLQNNYCGEFTAESEKCSTLPQLKSSKASRNPLIINFANVFYED